MTQHTLTHQYDNAADRWHGSLERLQFLDAYATLMSVLDERGAFDGLPDCPNVLDAGTGTGALGVALARHRGPQMRFTGVDISEGMLDQARANLHAVGVQPQLVQGNITALDAPDASVDMATNAHVLEHLDDPAPALRELARVLKPGAPLLTLTSRWCPFTMLQQGWWRYRIIPIKKLTAALHEAGFERVVEVRYAEVRHIRHMSRAVIAFRE
ncbi:MAG: class I SAM-dependent methyltransferase [Chloroflexota bacterium]